MTIQTPYTYGNFSTPSTSSYNIWGSKGNPYLVAGPTYTPGSGMPIVPRPVAPVPVPVTSGGSDGDSAIGEVPPTSEFTGFGDFNIDPVGVGLSLINPFLGLGYSLWNSNDPAEVEVVDKSWGYKNYADPVTPVTSAPVTFSSAAETEANRQALAAAQQAGVQAGAANIQSGIQAAPGTSMNFSDSTGSDLGVTDGSVSWTSMDDSGNTTGTMESAEMGTTNVTDYGGGYYGVDVSAAQDGSEIVGVEGPVGGSNDSSSDDGGGSYIATAATQALGEEGLQVFNNWRDYMSGWHPTFKTSYGRYRVTAPKIVAEIDKKDNSKELYKGIWDKHLKPIFDLIKEDMDNPKALSDYKIMVKELMNKYLK